VLLEELQGIQRAGARELLHALRMACWERYRDAARLVGVPDPLMADIEDHGYKSVGLTSLLPIYQAICDTYNAVEFSGQASLFVDSTSDPGTQWARYFYHQLLPTITRDNDAVRCVLTLTGLDLGLPESYSENLILRRLNDLLPQRR